MREEEEGVLEEEEGVFEETGEACDGEEIDEVCDGVGDSDSDDLLCFGLVHLFAALLAASPFSTPVSLPSPFVPGSLCVFPVFTALSLTTRGDPHMEQNLAPSTTCVPHSTRWRGS